MTDFMSTILRKHHCLFYLFALKNVLTVFFNLSNKQTSEGKSDHRLFIEANDPIFRIDIKQVYINRMKFYRDESVCVCVRQHFL